MPHHLSSLDKDGVKFDADQMSTSGASALSESQRDGSSGRSESGFSQTSKKSKRQGAARKQERKLRKKRVVKEGSPFEEIYLLELLKEETKINH